MSALKSANQPNLVQTHPYARLRDLTLEILAAATKGLMRRFSGPGAGTGIIIRHHLDYLDNRLGDLMSVPLVRA